MEIYRLRWRTGCTEGTAKGLTTPGATSLPMGGRARVTVRPLPHGEAGMEPGERRRWMDGRRTFRLREGAPQPTSHGEDLYCSIFGADA